MVLGFIMMFQVNTTSSAVNGRASSPSRGCHFTSLRRKKLNVRPSWEISKDGRTFNFFLRKDVKWHPREGEEARPFTADDVVFTWNIMMNPRTITPLKVRYEFIEKVEKTGDYSVVFTLKRPILNALAKFTFKIIPRHGPANPEYLTREDPFARAPIGTGPYMLKTITGDGEVVLLSNPDYFKGKAHIDKFIAKPFADQNIMAQALMFNAVDMIVLVNPRNQ